MSVQPLLLLATTTAPAVDANVAPADPVSFQTALLVIVTGALLFIAKNLAALNRRLTEVETNGTAAPFPRPAAAAPAPAENAATGPTPAVVAAITAAVHIAVLSRHRILSIGHPCPHRQAWSVEGRRQVFQSHKVR